MNEPSFKGTADEFPPVDSTATVNTPAPHPQRAESVASRVSGISARSSARRAQVERDRLARQHAEDLKRKQEDAELNAADAESQCAPPPDPNGDHPWQERSQAEILMSQLKESKQRTESLTNALKGLGVSTEPVDQSPAPRPIAQISSKIKITPPKPWKGSFLHHELEGWILTATGYLAHVGILLEDDISDHLAPQANYVLRSLMSPDPPTSDGISAQKWFDSTQRRTPFSTSAQMFTAMRQHWRDPQAEQRTRRDFQNATQGLLKAKEWAARLESLANLVVGRDLTEQDLVDRFLDGLSSKYTHHVLPQYRQRKRDNLDISLNVIADIASDVDGIEFATKRSPAPIPTSAHSPISAFSRESPPAAWISSAETWQKSHAWADKSQWWRGDGRASSTLITCFNCCKAGYHFSVSCPNARVLPSTLGKRKPVAAAVKLSHFSASSFDPETSVNTPASDYSGKGIDE